MYLLDGTGEEKKLVNSVSLGYSFSKTKISRILKYGFKKNIF